MKRDLVFVKDGGVLGEALGLDPKRCALFDSLMADYISQNLNLRQAVEKMNERGDMTDAEWTVFMYGLGWYQRGGGRF